MKTFIRLGMIRLSLTRLKIRRFVGLREEQHICTFRKKEACRFTVETNIFDQRYNLLLFVCKTVKHATSFSWIAEICHVSQLRVYPNDVFYVQYQVPPFPYLRLFSHVLSKTNVSLSGRQKRGFDRCIPEAL